MTPYRAAPHFVGARHAVPVLRISFVNLHPQLERPTNAHPSRNKWTPTVNLTPLNAALTACAANTANKRLTKTLKPLDATFTKFRGVPIES